jgi:hypothetical protein
VHSCVGVSSAVSDWLEYSDSWSWYTKVPTIEDMDSLLNFVDSVMDDNSWMTLRNILQTQYDIDEGFVQLPSFRRTLLFLKDTLPIFCQKIDNNALSDSKEANNDLFGSTRTKFENLLKDDKALDGMGRKLPFHCQHILMNCNELISDWPFGHPKKIIFGFGSEVGVKMLKQVSFLKMTTEQSLVAVLNFVKSRDKWELESVGIELTKMVYDAA